MSEQGGIIENLGFEVKLEGTFNNTEVVNGKLQLKKKTENPVTYFNSGTWISKIIDIGDEFDSYSKIIAVINNASNSAVSFSTRTSSDGSTFNTWSVALQDGSITSIKQRFIQVKADILAGMTDERIEIKATNLVSNEFIENIMHTPPTPIVPVLTSDTSSANGVAFSSSNAGSAYLAWKAFDGLSTTFMRTGVGQTTGQVGFLFNTPQKIYKYTVGNYTPMSNIMATGWELQASNDTTNGLDGSWIVLDIQTSQSWGTTATVKEYSVTIQKEYKAYRLNLTANTGGATIGIGELNFITPLVENIQLKRDYQYSMTRDKTWGGEGSLHRKLITANEWLRIDKMSIIDGHESEIVTAVPVMTSNTAPSGIADASSVFDNDSRYMAWKAFDGLTGVTASAWIAKTVANEWVSYEFIEPVVINKYSIVPNLLMNGSQPKDFRFEGWDGSNWIVLDSRSNITTGWSANVHMFFKFNNDISYKKYRLFVVSNNGFASYMSVAELGMYKRRGVN